MSDKSKTEATVAGNDGAVAKSAAKAAVDPRRDMVNVFIPKGQINEENYQFVSVGDKTYQIMRGTDVAVPRPVAEVLKNSSYAARVSEIVIEREQSKFNEAQQAQ